MRWTFHFPRRRVAEISYFPGRYFSRGLRVRISRRGHDRTDGAGLFEHRRSEKRKLARCVHIAHPTRYMYSIAPRWRRINCLSISEYTSYFIEIHRRSAYLANSRYSTISGVFSSERQRSHFLFLSFSLSFSPYLSMHIFTLKRVCPNVFSPIHQKFLEIENCRE